LFTVRDDASTLDAAALAADYLEDLVVGTVREVHGAVAGRVHGINDKINGGGPTVSHRLHDGIAKAVYGGIRVGFKAGSSGLRAASRAGVGADIEATSRGRFVRAAVNGLIGDRLREEGSNFAFDMGVRVGGRDVVLDREGVAAAYPAATGRLVVFVHGLSENEAYWNRAARPRTEARRERPETRSYGSRLVDEGWTPVYLRVNTGLPIAENGVAIAALLDRLVRVWPVDVRRIALVGHSMGGLILRAGCAVTTDSDSPWTELVTDVICLGTPHLGAPLERAVNRGVTALGRLPEAAPFGRILEYRSVGILDLRHGLASDVQNLPNARYRLVAATLTRSPRSVTAGTIGDYLVPYASALGRPRRGEEMFPGAETLHVPLADHFDLLNHDDIYAAVRGWLASDPDDRSDPPTQQEAAYA
jgi:pimeloyl-ACP methyl ester carboxylesterase